MQSRYVDTYYRLVSPGERLWAVTYNYSGKSMKCTSFRKPVEVEIAKDYSIVNVPGYKGRKMPMYYWGYLYSTEQLANQAFEMDLKSHIFTMQDNIEAIVESLQGLCKRDPQIRSMREVDEIKQSLLKYAQIL